MGLFYYPNKKHTRSEVPPRYKRYQSYKPFLKREFRGTCVYCRKPDWTAESEFGTDHYKPQVDFPSLSNDYDNLFYACNSCNRKKGTKWPSPKERKQGMVIPNPCDYVMSDHLKLDSAKTVRAKSKYGEWSVRSGA